jgi:hypothetical protein
MAYRVVQWATGIHGRLAIRGILDHPELELVGVKVYSDDKHGVDAGQLCGRADTGIKATKHTDDILALKPDCVVYMPLMANPDEVIPLLEAGISVVTSCGWVYPVNRDTVKLEAACKKGGAVLHGTGIHPGGLTEKLPLMASAFVTNVRYVRGEEFSDLRTYDAKDVVTDIMMFGKTRDELASSIMKDVLADGFTQSIDMVADEIGVKLDKEYKTTHRWSLATADIDTPFGVLEKNTVAAQHFSWQGCVKGKPVIEAAVNWYMGNEHLEAGWDLGKERFEMEVIGDNRIQLVTEGLHADSPDNADGEESALVATAMHCVNAVPYLCQSEPGIKTYRDLPMITGRADSALIG